MHMHAADWTYSKTVVPAASLSYMQKCPVIRAQALYCIKIRSYSMR